MFQNATTIWDRKREYATGVEPRAGWQRFGGLGYLARRYVARVTEFLTSANSSTISCSSRAPWSPATAILKFPFRSFAIAVSIQPRDGLQIPADGFPVWTAQPATQSSQHLGRRNLQADGNEPVPSCGAQGWSRIQVSVLKNFRNTRNTWNRYSNSTAVFPLYIRSNRISILSFEKFLTIKL